jgi:FixJ family two-component response regulator
MNPSEATIFVVDDDASVRRGLARVLRSAGWNVEVCGSAEEFLERPPYSGTGCLVLDVRMPGMAGTELHEKMAECGLIVPVIFLTGHADVPTGVRAMKNGAADFLLKPVDDETLLQAVAEAAERHAVQRRKKAQQREIQARIARLSLRELEVMKQVVQGRPNKQIGADLGIVEKTIKAHRGKVMEKMRAGSVAELVRLCDAADLKLH